MAQPRHVDPAELGQREIAGYFCTFGRWRHHTDHGTRIVETLTRPTFDAEVADYGRDHPWPCHWEHGGTGRDQLATVPIGKAVLVAPDDYGAFCVVELREGRLQDEILAAARAGDLGFSFHALDVDSDAKEEFGGRWRVVRHRMNLAEITLTGRPADPGAVVVAAGGGGRRQAPAEVTGLDLDDLDDLDAKVDALFRLTGHSRAAAELRAMQERGAREAAAAARARDLAGRVRRLAWQVTSEDERAARLRAEAAQEAGRFPPARPVAVILAESITAGAAAENARAELRELCQNDDRLVEDVLKGAQG
jgi:phage head maturation protease